MTVDYTPLETGLIRVPRVSGSSPRKTRRVLVVSYDFPPNRTSAVYRMTGLTKYLPDFGWLPTVLTIRAGENTQEPKLLEKLPPSVEVIRTQLIRINGWENRVAKTVAGAGGLQPAATVHHERR